MHYNLHLWQHAGIPLSSKKFAKQGGGWRLGMQVGCGGLSWIVGWLVLALKSRGLVYPEGNDWTKVYMEV
jgi:hypothetical protein